MNALENNALNVQREIDDLDNFNEIQTSNENAHLLSFNKKNKNKDILMNQINNMLSIAICTKIETTLAMY